MDTAAAGAVLIVGAEVSLAAALLLPGGVS